MTENVHRQPEDSRFQSEEARKRSLIQNIERILDTTNQLTLNTRSLSTFANQINEVVDWVRSSNQDYRQGKKAVLANLRSARIELQTACGEFDKRGRSQAFFRAVERGRGSLEDALSAW